MLRKLKKSRVCTHRVMAVGFAMVCLISNAAGAADIEGAIDLEAAGDETVFTYRGLTGPEYWGTLDDEWALCGEGLEQSPVDFDALGAIAEDVSDISFDYHDTMVSWTNNGHTVMMEYEPGSRMTLGGVSYELLQFHYHTPSEHSIQGGAHFELEQHLVHRNQAGELAVVGVMIREGAYNPALPGGVDWTNICPRPKE